MPQATENRFFYNRLLPHLAILYATLQLANHPINRRALLIKIVGNPPLLFH